MLQRGIVRTLATNREFRECCLRELLIFVAGMLVNRPFRQSRFLANLCVVHLPLVGKPITRFKNNVAANFHSWALSRDKSPSQRLVDYFNKTYGKSFNDKFFKQLEARNKTHLYPEQYEWYKYQQSQEALPYTYRDVYKMLTSGDYQNITNTLVDHYSNYVDPVKAISYMANKIQHDLAQPRKPSNIRGGRRNHTTPIYDLFNSYFKSYPNNTNNNTRQVIASNIPISLNETVIPTPIANNTQQYNSFLNNLINNNNTKLIKTNMDAVTNQPTFYSEVNPYTYNVVRNWPTNYPDISYFRPLTNHHKRKFYYKYNTNSNNSNKNDTQKMVIYGRNKYPLQRMLNRRRQRARRNQMRRYKTVNSQDSYVFDCYRTYNANGQYGLDGTHFNNTYCIRTLLGECVLWPQTAALYNQFKVTYFTMEIRQLLSYRYYINQPVIAVNCLYNANASSSFGYEDVRSSTGSMVYHMEKNYFVYKHRFNFTQSPSPGLGKYTDLDKNQQSTYLEPHDADTYVFCRSNLPFKFDLTGLPGGETDDLSAVTPVFEVHFKFWVKLKGKMQ